MATLSHEKQRLETARAEYEIAVAQMKQELADKLAEAEAQKSAFSKAIEELKSEKESLANQAANLEESQVKVSADNEELRVQNTGLTAQIEAVEAKASETIGQLQISIQEVKQFGENVNQELQSKVAELAAANEAYIHLQKQKDDALLQMETLSAEIETLKQAGNQVEASNAELKNRMHLLSVNADRELKASVRQCETRMEEMAAELKSEAGQVGSLTQLFQLSFFCK